MRLALVAVVPAVLALAAPIAEGSTGVAKRRTCGDAVAGAGSYAYTVIAIRGVTCRRARRPRPRTRITAMRLRFRTSAESGPENAVAVAIRVRVCGRSGNLAVRVTETLSPPGRNRPVLARGRRSARRAQDGRCQTHRFRWSLAGRFFGVGRYRSAVRARTTGRLWSRVAALHRDTFD